MVCAAVQPVAVRSANFSVARSPARSTQLTSTPRFDTDNCGCPEFGAAGVEIVCGGDDVWRATALAVAAAAMTARVTVHATAKAVALQTSLLKDMSQFEQLPAPRGSPHAPHGDGPAIRGWPPDDGALTANTDNCLLNSVAAHFGHSSLVDSRTNNSNWWSQDRHWYS